MNLLLYTFAILAGEVVEGGTVRVLALRALASFLTLCGEACVREACGEHAGEGRSDERRGQQLPSLLASLLLLLTSFLHMHSPVVFVIIPVALEQNLQGGEA